MLESRVTQRLNTPFILVLMPFTQEATRELYKTIKPAYVGADATCERIDEQTFDGTILDRIYDQIVRADLIVAEVTDGNLAKRRRPSPPANCYNPRIVLLVLPLVCGIRPQHQ
jgi:hypothetical protein